MNKRSFFIPLFYLLTAQPVQAEAKFSVLQLNLCNSGHITDPDHLKDCPSNGESIDEGIKKIERIKPDVVTVNEVCRNDVTRMAQGTNYRFVFTAVRNLKTGGLFKCKGKKGNEGNEGQDYGIGILTKAGYGNPVENPHHKAFIAQVPDQDEGRVYGARATRRSRYAPPTWPPRRRIKTAYGWRSARN